MKRVRDLESSDSDKDQIPLVNNGSLGTDLQMVVVDPSPREWIEINKNKKIEERQD